MSKTDIVIDNIRIPVSACDEDALEKAKKQLKKNRIPYIAETLRIRKKSVDARHKDNITFVCSVRCESEKSYDTFSTVRDFSFKPIKSIEIKRGTETLPARPYIIGFGPAGMFAGLLLAEHGLRPVILERGASLEERIRKVDEFYATGKLDLNTNIQFGAGGAGTFSDGKLITRIGDERTSYVLEKLHQFGAPEDILYRAKPHIGTDILRKVVQNIGNEIVRLGGEIKYNTFAESVGDGYVVVNGSKIECGPVIVAPGHSSRDFISNLIQENYSIETKPFSVGVRIEHIQEELDLAMYGNADLYEKLGHAEYSLSHRKGERGVYSFCMCPGGEVMAATSEEGAVVTNGMSRHARDGRNANSAIVVSVLPGDFGSSPYDAINFQRYLETKAYEMGGRTYSAPCQTVKDFYNGAIGKIPTRVIPSYMNGNVTPADFNSIFPGFISSLLKEGLNVFGRKIRGFDNDDIPLTGVETRTSSPVRIIRGENFVAINHSLVYPCGEGAGFAGGITSAAVDGLRVAEAILTRFK